MSFFFFLRPSSSSSSSLQSLCLICTVFIFLVLFLINVEGFEPLIQLPHSPAARPRLETKILYVNQFGAKGDGVQDDTDVIVSAFLCVYLFIEEMMLWLLYLIASDFGMIGE